MRQPYLKGHVPEHHYREFPKTEHIHFFGFYIGNYPELGSDGIDDICAILNAV